MTVMDSPEDFFKEDETLAERKAAWHRGEPGFTTGTKALSQRAGRAVDRAVSRWAARSSVVGTGTVVGETKLIPFAEGPPRELTTKSTTTTDQWFAVA